MKYNFFTVLILFAGITYQSSIYNIQFDKLGNGSVTMSSYANKKIVILVFNSANPDVMRLRYLDSLQNADASLQVIAVAATDLGGTGSNASLIALRNTLSTKLVMTKSTKVKKAAGNNQHPLLKWLTYVNENAHFDNDAEAAGQLFVISRTGVLYGILGTDTPDTIINSVLNQTTIQ